MIIEQGERRQKTGDKKSINEKRRKEGGVWSFEGGATRLDRSRLLVRRNEVKAKN